MCTMSGGSTGTAKMMS